jgi:hypothetical protein
MLIVSLNNNYLQATLGLLLGGRPLMKNTTLSRTLGCLVVGALSLIRSAAGATVPYTEDFVSGAANWGDNTGLNLLSHVASGGPDGGAYASTNKSLQNLADSSLVLFRGQDEFNSSNHAFEGNWVAQNIGQFSAYVRHNAPLPLSFFTRFSAPANFPGGTAVKFAPVPPNTWTQLTFDIGPSNPEFVTFEGSSFGAVFSNIGHVQVGVSVPASLAANPNAFSFDIDKVSIARAIPEPTTFCLALVVGMVLAAMRTAELG